jgi:hypothetical protein
MQVGMRFEASDDEIDETLESGLFVVARKRPISCMNNRAIGGRVGVPK